MQKKTLGLFTLIALVVGNMIGSGIFILPTDLAKIGSISLLSWLFTAGGAILLGLVFSKMSSLFPETGGPYSYAKHSFGNAVGLQVALYYWIAIMIGVAGIAIALIGYLRVFCPWLTNPFAGTLTAIAIIWLLTIVNILGIRKAAGIQSITMILKCAVLLLIALFGWLYFHPEYITTNFNVTDNKSNLSAFSYAATLTMWAFIGMESATVPAGNVINPRRNIPLATMLGIAIAAFIYIATSTVIMGILPHATLANTSYPFAEAANIIFGPWGKWLIAVGAMISCFGTLNGLTILHGQVGMAAADDHMFPKIFAHRNKANMPGYGLTIGAILISIFLLLTTETNLINQFHFIALTASIIFLVVYLVITLAEIKFLRNSGIKANRGNLIIALLACIYTLWAIIGAGSKILLPLVIIFATSICVHFIQHKFAQKL